MSDLIERLRDFDLTRQFTGGQHPLITEAADEIERLQFIIAVYEKSFQGEIYAENKALQAKVDALRDALTLSDRMLREYEVSDE